MTLMKKFATLTPEQRDKFAAVKDAASLDAFASENNIALTDEEKTQAHEYFQSGMLPLDDDDLDGVAGGAAKDISPALAAADGRIYNLPRSNYLCACHQGNKWARYERMTYKSNSKEEILYNDIKCYKCGKTWESHLHTITYRLY